MSDQTPAAREMRIDVARRGALLWRDMLESIDPTRPDDGPEMTALRSYSISFAAGLMMALQALAEVDPVRADLVSREITATWEHGPAAGQFLWEQAEQFGVLTPSGEVIPRGLS